MVVVVVGKEMAPMAPLPSCEVQAQSSGSCRANMTSGVEARAYIKVVPTSVRTSPPTGLIIYLVPGGCGNAAGLLAAGAHAFMCARTRTRAHPRTPAHTGVARIADATGAIVVVPETIERSAGGRRRSAHEKSEESSKQGATMDAYGSKDEGMGGKQQGDMTHAHACTRAHAHAHAHTHTHTHTHTHQKNVATQPPTCLGLDKPLAVSPSR